MKSSVWKWTKRAVITAWAIWVSVGGVGITARNWSVDRIFELKREMGELQKHVIHLEAATQIPRGGLPLQFRFEQNLCTSGPVIDLESEECSVDARKMAEVVKKASRGSD